MTNWEFSCPQPASILVTPWPAGSVAISGADTDVMTVQVVPTRRGSEELLDLVRVTFDDGRLVVNGPRLTTFMRRAGLDLTIKAPAGSSCDIHTAAADVSCVGELGALSVNTASGDVTAAAVGGKLAVKSASGDIFVDQAQDDARVDSVSGDVHLGYVRGDLEAKATSGDLTIGDVGGSLAANTVSGDVDIKSISSGRANIEALSGDITVAVARGIGVYLDLSTMSGDVRNELDEADEADQDGGGDAEQAAALELRCRTISGDIRVRKSSTRTAGAADEPADA
jgi:DUF4097 and DUF4098 domain-containing protein YvlB